MKLTRIGTRFVLATVLAVGLGSLAWTAQETETKAKTGKSTTVTGCLQKGDEAGEYTIKGEDGKTYGLRASKSVDLSKHVGHKVTVTGTKMREGAMKEKKEAGAEEAEHLRVTNLQHISEGCQ
jgi:hypothetical protein